MSASKGAVVAAALLAAGLAAADGLPPVPSETLRPLAQHGLPAMAGAMLTAVEVRFPAGSRASPHTHGAAFLFVYVLEGSVRSQIENEPVRTYTIGESWTEQPRDHHVVTENASLTTPATLLVIFVAPPGAALKTGDPATTR